LLKKLDNAKLEGEVHASKATQLEREIGSMGGKQREVLEQQRASEMMAGEASEQVEKWKAREQQLLAEMHELRRDMAACQAEAGSKEDAHRDEHADLRRKWEGAVSRIESMGGRLQ
jgi:hypothetical protein